MQRLLILLTSAALLAACGPTHTNGNDNGNGNELCAWSLRVRATGGASLVAFDPGDPGSTLWGLRPDELRVNGGDPTNGQLTPEKVGTLTVNVESEGAIELVGGGGSTAVLADLGLEPLAQTVIAVPEPSSLLVLILGTGFLCTVGRGRM